MGAPIPFTRTYTDVSTYEGYQYEFSCQRCGNGYRSAFRHSAAGFGGRLASLGGALLGGELGATVQEVGMLAQWDRSSTRGSTSDRRLMEAAQEVAHEFAQCRRCTEWVCRGVCWDDRAGCCRRCAEAAAQQHGQQSYGQPGHGPGYGPHGHPQPYGQPPHGRPAPRQTGGHPLPAPAGPSCPGCGAAASGRFCGSCGCPVAPPPACTGCGAPPQGTPFCPHCGTKAG